MTTKRRWPVLAKALHCNVPKWYVCVSACVCVCVREYAWVCVCVDAQTKCPATYVVCVCACVCVSLCECARVSVCEGVSVRKRPAHCTQSSALYARAICVCLCHVKSMNYIMSTSRTEHGQLYHPGAIHANASLTIQRLQTLSSKHHEPHHWIARTVWYRRRRQWLGYYPTCSIGYYQTCWIGYYPTSPTQSFKSRTRSWKCPKLYRWNVTNCIVEMTPTLS